MVVKRAYTDDEVLAVIRNALYVSPGMGSPKESVTDVYKPDGAALYVRQQLVNAGLL